jgi:hypothetical protein
VRRIAQAVAAACALIALCSCTTITIEPRTDVAVIAAKSKQPALHFDYHHTFDARLAYADAGAEGVREVDGEELYPLTLEFQKALLQTGAFATVTRAKPGSGLHCDFELRRHRRMANKGVFLVWSLGLLPDHKSDDLELIATVRADGKEPRTYRARTRSSTWLWLPLAPIGAVQFFTMLPALQQTVDSIAAQMAQDGGLER